MIVFHDTFAVINIIGCIYGMILMLNYYKKEVEFKHYEKLWNTAGFACFAFCFFACLKEWYSLFKMPLIDYSTWMFKFATSGIWILTIIFRNLVKRYKKIDKSINDKD